MTAALNYSIGIDVDTDRAFAKVNKLDAALGRLGTGKAANDNFGKALEGISKKADGAAKATGKIGTVLNDIKGRAAGAMPAVGNMLSSLMAYGPAGAVVGAVALALAAVGTAAVKAASQVEVWKANLLTMTKSSQAADGAYRALVDFANKTPFSLEQSVTGFTKLRALGLATSTDIMTSYGNTAAAMGKDMSQIIEAVADATTGEFERLKEFGIKASTEGNKVKFTFQGVTKTVSKNATDIQKYIVDIGKTNFGGAMARQMATATGAFANFSDQIFNTLAAMGDGTLLATVAKVTGAVTAGIGAITPLLSGIMDVIGGILSAAVDIGAGLLSVFTGGSQGAANMKSGLDNLAVAFAFVGETIRIVGSVFGSVFGFIGELIGSVVGFAQKQFASMFDWLVPTTSSAGQSMGESFVGILRAAGYVAGQLPNIFSVALAELKAMFAQAGAAMAASLTGDFSKWGNVDLSFGRTQKVAGRVLDNAVKIQGNQKANRAWIDNAKGVSAPGSLDFAAAGKDKPAKDDKAAKDAEQRLKQEREFWQVLKDQAATAALLPLAAEDYSKQLELQKILGRDLTAGEKDRVNTAMQAVRTNKFLTDALDAHNKKSVELGQQEATFAARLKGMTEDQASVEKQVYDFRNSALQQGIDLQSQTYKLAEAQVRADAARGVQLDKNNALLQQGVDLFGSLNKASAASALCKRYADQRAALGVAYNSGENGGRYSLADYEKTLAKINKNEAKERQQLDEQLRAQALDKWGSVIYGLADVFGGALGRIADQFEDLAGSLNGDSGIGGLMKSLGAKGGFDKTLGSWFGKKSGLAKTFTGLFGKNGTLVKGLGDKLGQMGAGAQVGQITGSIMKGLGIKTSGTGAQIGGALGSFGGPIGSIAGSIIGGVMGGLLKKAKWGTTSITNGVMSTAGNKSAYKDNSANAGNSITSGLQGIAEQLGAELGGGYSVSIGQYKGKWRVSTSGRSGKLKGKYGDVQDFGKDGAEAALKYAIADAIQDGALVGLRASTKALLNAGDDLEAQMDKALRFEGVFKDLKSRVDPVGAAIDTLNQRFKGLAFIFKEASASAEEYGQLQQLQALELQDLIKQQTSSFQSILDSLNGEAGGFSAMSLLNRNLAQLDTYKADIAAGRQVDQDAFTDTMDKIINGVTDIYGANSAAGQGILADVKKATTDAMALVTTQITQSATTDAASAIQALQAAQTAGTNIGNGYLKQILEAIKANGAVSGLASVAASAGNVNGRVTLAY